MVDIWRNELVFKCLQDIVVNLNLQPVFSRNICHGTFPRRQWYFYAFCVAVISQPYLVIYENGMLILHTFSDMMM